MMIMITLTIVLTILILNNNKTLTEGEQRGLRTPPKTRAPKEPAARIQETLRQFTALFNNTSNHNYIYIYIYTYIFVMQRRRKSCDGCCLLLIETF